MEKGSLRADVNVSVRKPGAPLGTRCEIKNVNSIRFIGQAIEYEARRQIEIIEDGGTIEQETRLFDPDKGETRSMRSRRRRTTTAISPIPTCCRWSSTQAYVDGAEGRICRSCRTTRRRASSRDYGLSAYDADVLVAEQRDRRLSSRRWRKGRDAKVAANWVINELSGRLNKEGKDIADVAGHRRAARRACST